MLYVVLLYLAVAHGLPVQNQVGTHPLYYFPKHQQQYVRTGYVPQYPHYYPQYVNPSAKNVHSSSSQNELIYYPTIPGVPANQVLVSPEVNPGITPANTQRFTPPPHGLVNAIFAWFAENNVSVPDGPGRNEILSDQPEKEKVETPEKPVHTEVEVIFDEKQNQQQSYVNVKKTNSNSKPGQRFYVLNNQPQYFQIPQYAQSVVPHQIPQSFIPQVALRNAIPQDPNLLFFQPQSEFQQSHLKFKNPGAGQIQNLDVYTPQNVVLLKSIPEPNQEKEEVKPIRYHGSELTKKFNQQQSQQQQQFIQNYPQQVFFERLLPQGNDIRNPSQLQTLYQTHYVPIGVVPPQEGNLHQYTIRNQERPQEFNQQPFQFIQIPVNKDVQLPQYIKTLVPLTVDPNQKIEDVNNQNNNNNQHQQQVSSRFAPHEFQQEKQADEEKQDPNSEIPSLDFVKYLNDKNNDQFSDTVVIDAKTENENKKEENNNNNTNNDEEVVQADEPSEPTIAQAQPAGIALAGPGGVASTAPRGTALAGEKGLAVSSPRATAVAGPNTNKEDKPSKKS